MSDSTHPADTQALDEALRQVVDAVRHAQRLGLGRIVHVNFHDMDADHFNAPHSLSPDSADPDATPTYGRVKGQEHGYLSRTLLSGNGVLLQLFHDVPARAEVS